MREFALLFVNKSRIIKNCFFSLSSQPLTKIIFITIFIVAFLGAAFFAFYEGFNFLHSLENIGLIIIERLFYLFFMGLFFMLVFSNIIVSYSTIYRSQDLGLLFSHPIDSRAVFTIKFFESLFLSSWAFFFVLGPFMAAYGIFRKMGIAFYIIGSVVFIPFLIISASLGSIIAMLVVRFLNRSRRQLLISTSVVIAIVGGIFWFKMKYQYQSASGSFFIINQLIPHFDFAQNPLWPNFWLVEAIMGVTKQDLSASLFYGLLILSNAFFFFMVCLYLSAHIYQTGWVNLESPLRLGKFPLESSPIEKIRPFFGFLSPDERALVIKDLKLFWRDPMQRIQFLIFFGLLAIYFGNLQNLSYHLLPVEWKNAVSFLNLFATTLVLASLSVRFVFPQISLETKTFWILGLTPVSVKKIIWEKFWLSSIISLFITESLIILSNLMLKASIWMSVVSMSVVFIVCFALIGLSCGLGAIWPNFKENNPAAIVSGFGGTINLILALVYLGSVLSLLALPLHLYFIKHIGLSDLKFILSISGIIILISSLITCFLPLWLGVRNLKRAEF